MNNIIWKDIPGFEGKYQVSNTGLVKSLSRQRTHERILKFEEEQHGYLRVTLNKKHYLVHRLVAICFIDNPDNLPIINHKDENPKNNDMYNLEWCTYSYNSNYGTRTAKFKKAAINNIKNSKSILQLDKQGNLIKKWPSAREIERAFDRTSAAANVIQCCKGKRNSSYGFKWKYAD